MKYKSEIPVHGYIRCRLRGSCYIRDLEETRVVNMYGSVLVKTNVQRTNNIIGESVHGMSVDFHVKDLVCEK